MSEFYHKSLECLRLLLQLAGKVKIATRGTKAEMPLLLKQLAKGKKAEGFFRTLDKESRCANTYRLETGLYRILRSI